MSINKQKGKIYLFTNDNVRLTTLQYSPTAVRPTTRCAICNRGRRVGNDPLCFTPGQQGHCPIIYRTATTSSPVSFLKREASDTGSLKQELCAFASLFHMQIKLSEGKTKDHVGLTIDMEPCSEAKGKYKALPSKIRSVFIKLKFLDVNGQILDTKFLTTIQRNPNTWKELRITNDHFCSVEVIKKCLQTELWSVVRDLDIDPAVDVKPIPYEFVEVQLSCRLEVENHAKFWLSGQSARCIKSIIEDNHHQRQCFMIQQRLKFSHQSGNSTCNANDESTFSSSSSSSSTSSSSSASSSAVVTEPIAKKARLECPGTCITADSSSSSQSTFVSRYAQTVTLVLGSPYDLQFFVPKFLLIEQSPVFKAMFDANMQERRTGEVILPDDVSPNAVEGFLDLLFDRTDSQVISQTPIILLEILSLTHLYQMSKLMEQVLELITCIPQETLNVQLAVNIFGAGERYEIPCLKYRAMQWITLNKETVLSDKGKGELDKVASTTPRIFSAFMEWLL